MAKAEQTLGPAGTDKARLLTAALWLRDIADFDAMNDIWDGWIAPQKPPACTSCECRLANRDILVEITFTTAQ
ncbi:hypothetical protein ASF70_02915 [Rhizobium sp. Leaf321]|uniref:Rid family hydrolase n=1 Tax=Rhizobium sp. Leaf321 TaxID=1736335 RepID=UPI0007158B61|nr:Rid family hydrolase [Rhizobium sp. Leaf321]KQQ74867.1 hypothetical protein ASF70_02915 [Rhizobium sp. Leaf321]